MFNMTLKPTNTSITLVLVFVAFMFIAGPIVQIWALNTLFPSLAIPLTFETWLAAFVLFASVTGTRFSNQK